MVDFNNRNNPHGRFQAAIPSGPSNRGMGSQLVESMIDKTRILIPPKSNRFKMPKAVKIATPKAASTDKATANVHPFILEHRVGTTERITAMDPMSEDFIKSLRIQYKGKYISRAAPATETVPAQVLNALILNRVSKFFKDQVADCTHISGIHLGDLGRPWKDVGPIDASFRIGTGCVTQKGSNGLAFASAKVMMETWAYRQPDASCTLEYENTPIRATLVNRFEAVKDTLLCYSFIMNYSAEQILVNVWVNRVYLEDRARLLPMYFEDYGSFTFILNAVTACMGLEVTPVGEVTLTVHGKAGSRTTKLTKAQVVNLMQRGVLGEFARTTSSTTVPWGSLVNVDWQNVGYDLQTNGLNWNLSSATSHLPWQVQSQRAKSFTALPTLKRTLQSVGGGIAGTRALFELPLSRRKAAISKAIGEALWEKIKTDNESETFDDTIRTLRTEYITGELLDEIKRIDGSVSARELFNMTWNSSDELGRFPFERSLPGYEAAVEVSASEG